MAKWMLATKRCDFKQIGDNLGVDQVVVRIMRNRGLENEESMRKFLNADSRSFYSYEYMKDVDKAVEILMDKIDEEQRIRVIGDYDVDGIMSTYILSKGLQICGADVDAVIPHRIRDGYGISEGLIDDAYADGVDTIITCDNGIAARDAFDHAKELGMTCIITDHHEIPFVEDGEGRQYIIPEVDAVVDPKQVDCEYPFKGICGAVVALKVIEALFDAIGEDTGYIEEFKELAGFATVCDVMELVGENRALVKNTLKSMLHSKNMGMQGLIKVCGLEGKAVKAHSIGFVLGPCINATGRLESAMLSLDLLRAETIAEAVEIAEELKLLNENRKELTEQGLALAEEIIAKDNIQAKKVMVVYIPGLHESLAGIIAGRIREKYYKPVFVVTDSEQGLKGSARSIPKYHIYEAMTKVKDVFTKYGGHALAAGFSLEQDRLKEFDLRINENCELTKEDFEEKIVIDVPMPMNYVSESLINQLEILEPFGVGNEKPVFAQKDVEFISCRTMGNGSMGRISVRAADGTYAQLVLFRNIDKLFETIDLKYGPGTSERLMSQKCEGIKMDIIYYPAINEYQGNRSIQFILNNYM